MPTPPSRMSRVATLLALLSVFAPQPANAQRQAFVDQLVTFRLFLFGPYGDEGTRIVDTLDRLSASLSAWDESIRRQEETLRRRVAASGGADSAVALVALLGGRGRLRDALIEIEAALAAVSGTSNNGEWSRRAQTVSSTASGARCSLGWDAAPKQPKRIVGRGSSTGAMW